MTQSASTRGYLFHLQVEGIYSGTYGSAQMGNSGLYDDQVNGGTDNGAAQVISGTANAEYNDTLASMTIDPHLPDRYRRTGASSTSHTVPPPHLGQTG